MQSLKKTITSWIFQIIASAILLYASYNKLILKEDSLNLFQTLGMGEAGLIIIGILELIAGISLIIGPISSSGAFLGFAVMLGATIAHATKLGFSNSYFLFIVLISTGAVLFIRRKSIPWIGKTLD